MDAESHSSRVSRLQAEHFADDLHPPRSAISWPDDRLQSWFLFGGGAQAELTTFVEQQQHDEQQQQADGIVTADLIDALHGGGIYTLDSLLAAADELSSLFRGSLSVGCRSRLKLALSNEKARRREAATANEHAAAERAADEAFFIAVAVRNNESSNANEDCNESSMTSTNFPRLPGGGEIQTGLAGSELGGRIWPCAALLSSYLLSPAGQAHVADACVVELGAGTGVVGLHAAASGARQLVLTDVFANSGKPGELERLLRDNIERNRALLASCGDALAVAELNFHKAAHAESVAQLALPPRATSRATSAATASPDGFDLVLVSDCTYESIGIHFDMLARTLARVLRHPDGEAIVCHEYRLKPDNPIASDGGDPALEKLRSATAAAGLARWDVIHDDRGRREFARSGMRCIVQIRR